MKYRDSGGIISGTSVSGSADNPADIRSARRLCNGYSWQAIMTPITRDWLLSSGKSDRARNNTACLRLKTNPYKIKNKRTCSGSVLMSVVARPFYRSGFHIQRRTSNRRNGSRRKPRVSGKILSSLGRGKPCYLPAVSLRGRTRRRERPYGIRPGVIIKDKVVFLSGRGSTLRVSTLRIESSNNL